MSISIYTFHVGSLSWIILHHGENCVQSYEKTWNFQHLEKISKFRNFDFSKWNLDFLISCWISFIFWHILMNYDLWNLNLTKKSKFDFLVYIWLLISWLKNSSVNPMDLKMFWTMPLGQNDTIGLLRSCLKPIDHLLGQKSEIALSQSKP